MKKYIVSRILTLIFLLWAVSSLIFFIIHAIPGDPVIGLLGNGENIQDLERIRGELNLDKSLLDQYLIYSQNILTLNMGKSFFNDQPVLSNIMDYLPNTLFLAFAAMTVAVVLSVPIASFAALKKNRLLDIATTLFSSTGLALPNFFLGPVLILIFSVKLGLLPVSGNDGFKYIILPALTLGLSMTAYLTLIVRMSLGLELQKPYVLLARAKGLSRFQILFKHVYKNSMIPVLSTVGLQLGALLTGTIITESIFSWQGIGVLLLKSINRRDYPMIQGLILFMTLLYLLIHFSVDLIYLLVDPRIRYEK